MLFSEDVKTLRIT